MYIEEIEKKLEQNIVQHGGSLFLETDFGYQAEELLDAMGGAVGILVKDARLQSGKDCVTVLGVLVLAGEDSKDLILTAYEKGESVYWSFCAEWSFGKRWEELFSLPPSRANEGSILSYYKIDGVECSVVQGTIIQRLICSFDTVNYTAMEHKRNEKNCVGVVMETDVREAPFYRVYHAKPYEFWKESNLIFSGTVYPFLGREPQFAVTAKMKAGNQKISLKRGKNSLGRVPVQSYGLCIHTHIPDTADYRNYQEANDTVYYVSEVQYLIYVDFGVEDFPEIFLSMQLFCIGISYQISISFGEEGLSLASLTGLLSDLLGSEFLVKLKQSLGVLGKLSLYQLGFVMGGELFASEPVAVLVDVGINDWQTPFSFLYAKQAGVRIILSMWSGEPSWEMVLYGSFRLFQRLVLQGQVILPYMEFQAELCEDVEKEKIALREAIPTELFSQGAFYLTSVRAYGNFLQGDYFCEVSINPEEYLSFSVGKLRFAMKYIDGYIGYQKGELRYRIAGAAEFASGQDLFAIGLSASYEKEEWKFEGELSQGAISVAGLAELVTGYRPPIMLDITRLYLSYTTSGVFLFLCEVEQDFYLFDNEKLAVKVSARLENTAEKKETYSVQLVGSLSFQEFLIMVMVHFQTEKEEDTLYEFFVQFREIYARAVYQENKLFVTLEHITIGGLLTMLFQTILPNVSFRLPSPWDVLNRIGFDKMELQYDLDTEEIQVSLELDIELLILHLTKIAFCYRKIEGKRSFFIQIYFQSLLEADEEGVREWDAFGNEPVPSINGDTEQVFSLNYFGLSHHVDLGSPSGDAPMQKILEEIRQKIRPESGMPEISYSGDTGWFIGADFILMESIRLCMLFYDPVIYGAQLEVMNDKVFPLKGLNITFYYRKATPDVGVFYVDVIFPDRLRSFDVGAFSISLPRIQAWIYTNGQFKFDFGFPKNGDFSQSAGISMGYYYGKGGFYIGWLDGNTSKQVPEVSNGYFSPVLELGVGILIGIGKSMNIGILKLKAELGLRAVFEGVFAQFHEKETEETAMYYKCSALVVIAGELSGEVNFVIIKAGFQLSVYLAVAVYLEACEPCKLQIEAYIKVSAYIKILFVKLSFSFSFHYKDCFTLGQHEPSLWVKCGENRLEQSEQEEMRGSVFSPEEFVFVIDKYLSEITEIHGIFSPMFSREGVRILWGTDRIRETEPSQKVAAAVLTFPISDFQVLLECVVLFLVRAAGFENGQSILKERMEELELYLQRNRPECFCAEDMMSLLQSNILLRVESSSSMEEDGEIDGVMFPFLSGLTLSFQQNFGKEAGIDSFLFKKNREEILYTEDYLGDAFYLLARTVSGKIADIMDDEMDRETLYQAVLRWSDELAGQMNHFLLHGVRLERDGEWKGLFDEMGCQFVCNGEKESIISYEFVLEKEEGTAEFVNFVCPEEDGSLHMVIDRERAIFPSETVRAGSITWMETERLTEDAVSFFEGRAVLGGKEEEYLYRWEKPLVCPENFSLEIWELGKNQDFRRFEDRDAERVEGRAYTGLELELRKTETEGFLQLFGMKEETKEKLRTILQRGAASITAVRLLLPASIIRNAGNAYWDYQLIPEKTAVIRCNLSEITTAFWENGMKADEEERYVAFLSEGYEVFLTLLLRAGEIGGNGQFIMCGTEEEIEQEVFDEEGHCSGLLVVETGTRAGEYTDGMLLMRKVMEESEKLLLFSKWLPKRCLTVMKPGWLGFTMEMPVPAQEDAVYHILYCQSVDERVPYTSPPVSIQDKEGEKESWKFAYLFPYYRFMQQSEEEGGVFPQRENPYLGIEENVPDMEYSFFLADVLGNASSEQTRYSLMYPLRYHDELIAVTEYPCTSLCYDLKQGSKEGAFCIEVILRYCKGPVDSLDKIALAYYQLAQKDVTVELGYYLDGECYLSETLLDKREILQYLEELYEYASVSVTVQDRLEEGKLNGERKKERWEEPKKEPGVVIEVLVPELPKQDCFAVYAWKVELFIRRSEKLTEESSLAHIASQSCLIPFSGEIEKFAEQIENILPQVKVLERDGIYLGIAGEGKKIVELKSGSKSGAYALAPLSTSFLSRNQVAVSSLAYAMEHLEEKEWLDETVIDVTEIDLDELAIQYLAFYEELLRPRAIQFLMEENGIAGKSVLQQLLTMKKKLADRIKEQVYSVIEGKEDEGAKKAAAGSIEEELRKDLYAGYQVAGAYCYEFHLDGGERYSLEGNVSNPSVKPSKLVGGCSFVPFLTVPGNPHAVRSVSMENVQFYPQFLEEQSSGKWYRLVRKFTEEQKLAEFQLAEDLSGNTVKIPVVLKDYPKLPMLKEQNWGVVHSSSVECASWEYSIQFETSISAQDRIYIRYLWDNLVCHKTSRNADRDLMGYLTCFHYQLSEYREKLAQEGNILKVYQAFLKLSEEICSVWCGQLLNAEREEKAVFIPGFDAEGRLVSFRQVEKYQQDLSFRIKCTDKNGIQAEFYEVPEQTGVYRAEKKEGFCIRADEAAIFSFTIGELLLKEYQSGTAKVYLTRNEFIECGKGEERADKRFIYQTEEQGFLHSVHPYINIQDLSVMSWSKENLENYLKLFPEELPGDITLSCIIQSYRIPVIYVQAENKLYQKAGWLYSYAKTWEQEHIRQETEVKWTVFITLYTRTGEKLLMVEKQMFKNL